MTHRTNLRTIRSEELWSMAADACSMSRVVSNVWIRPRLLPVLSRNLVTGIAHALVFLCRVRELRVVDCSASWCLRASRLRSSLSRSRKECADHKDQTQESMTRCEDSIHLVIRTTFHKQATASRHRRTSHYGLSDLRSGMVFP